MNINFLNLNEKEAFSKDSLSEGMHDQSSKEKELYIDICSLETQDQTSKDIIQAEFEHHGNHFHMLKEQENIIQIGQIEQQIEQSTESSSSEDSHWKLVWVQIPKISEFQLDMRIRQWKRVKATNKKSTLQKDKEKPQLEEKKATFQPSKQFPNETNLIQQKIIPINSSLEQQQSAQKIQEEFSKFDKHCKEYKCKNESCQKIFFDAYSLRKHFLLTHNDKKLQCEMQGCNKLFLDNSKLKRHQLVHTKEKPFKCEICGHLSSLSFNLSTHMRTHTGEKPYVCNFEGCKKKYSQKSNLASHIKTH